jgi:hypothetical protein
VNDEAMTMRMLLSAEHLSPAAQHRILTYGWTRDCVLLADLAARPDLHDDVADAISGVRDLRVRTAWLSNPDAGPDRARRISTTDRRATVQEAYAARADLTQMEYERLAATTGRVAWTILANPAAGFRALRIALRAVLAGAEPARLGDTRVDVLYQVTTRQPVLADDITELARTPALTARFAVHAGLTCVGRAHVVTWLIDTATRNRAAYAADVRVPGLFDDAKDLRTGLDAVSRSGKLTPAQCRDLLAVLAGPDGKALPATMTGFVGIDDAVHRLQRKTTAGYEESDPGDVAAVRAVTGPEQLEHWLERAVVRGDAGLAVEVLKSPHLTVQGVLWSMRVLGSGPLPQQVIEAHDDTPRVQAMLLTKAKAFNDRDVSRCRDPHAVLTCRLQTVIEDGEPLRGDVLGSRFLTEEHLRRMPAGIVLGGADGRSKAMRRLLAGLIDRTVQTAGQWEVFTTLVGQDDMTLADALDAAALIPETTGG